MAQPVKHKNAESMSLVNLMGTDGELLCDIDTLDEKPKRKTDTLTHEDYAERDRAGDLTDTRIFLQRFGITILAGVLGVTAIIPLIIFIVNDVIPAVWLLFLKSLPYLLTVLFVGSFVYLIREILIGLLALAAGALLIFLGSSLLFLAGVLVSMVIPPIIVWVIGLVIWAAMIKTIFNMG